MKSRQFFQLNLNKAFQLCLFNKISSSHSFQHSVQMHIESHQCISCLVNCFCNLAIHSLPSIKIYCFRSISMEEYLVHILICHGGSVFNQKLLGEVVSFFVLGSFTRLLNTILSRSCINNVESGSKSGLRSVGVAEQILKV